ncbi:MAG TPA: nitroreductase [Cyclobacteriaceae bacterium]|nr:nitroreductase [Cyclobacteriaceae bacterium]
MNETIKTINERRAVRKFKPGNVSASLLDQLLYAARMAPSALNGQPWKFFILTERELINVLDQKIKAVASKIFRMEHASEFFDTPNPIFHGAPIVIFIAADRKNEWAGLDVGMCAQNLMLAAKSLGLDTCTVGLAKFAEQTSVYGALGIPAGDQILIAISVGYGDENPAPHPRKTDNAFFVKYEHVAGLLTY